MKSRAFKRVSSQLTRLSLPLLIPASLMLHWTIIGINDHIAFAQLELDGNRYQRPLMLRLIDDYHGIVPSAHDLIQGPARARSRRPRPPSMHSCAN